MHSVTVNSPTELIFEQLKNKYSSSLSCTCSKVAIPYSKFLSIKITAHHQICSISNPNDSYIMSITPITYNNSISSCSCATIPRCSRSFLISNNKTEILP
ncbi:unnamed protein product, partial [Rotaria sp. Silwood1]